MIKYSQPGIFNALDDWGAGGMSTTNLGPANAAALQAAIDAAQSSGNPNGAIVLIPAFSLSATGQNQYGSYLIACQGGQTSAIKISNTGSTTPVLLCGTGGGTQLTMETGGTNIILFDVKTDFVTFQDLTIGFDHNLTKGIGTAFSFSGPPESGPQSCGLFRVTIQNCQFPALFSGTKHARVLECFINYGQGTFSTSTAVEISGGSDDTVVAQSLLSWNAGTQVAQNVGLLIDGASNVKVSDMQVAEFGTGIQIQGSSTKATSVHVIASEVETLGSCVVINPTVSDVNFDNCHFHAATGLSGNQPGIAVGMSGGTNPQIDTIRFTSCSLTGNTGIQTENGAYGLQIGVCQNIQVLGGNYSGNGATGGIAIVGGASEIQIVGANCIGLEYEAGQQTPPLYQQYGILVTNGTDIQIIGVNCAGNGYPPADEPGDGIHIDGSGSEATVSDVRIIGAVCTGPVFGNTAISQQNGIYVHEGQNVLVKGCTLTGSTSDSGYGLYLGAVTDVTVRSCDLYGNLVGLRIDTGSTRVYVRDCNATGYSSYTDAISIVASLAQVEVTNCAGYNDQHGVLTSMAPSGQFSGVSVAGYYGPTAFYVTGYAVTIDQQPTSLSSGAFTLAPGENAQLGAQSVSPSFLMIGN